MKIPKSKEDLKHMNIYELCELANFIKNQDMTTKDYISNQNVNYLYSDITNAISKLGGANLWVPLVCKQENETINITIPPGEKKMFRFRLPMSLCNEFESLNKDNRADSIIAALILYIDTCKHKKINILKSINNPNSQAHK